MNFPKSKFDPQEAPTKNPPGIPSAEKTNDKTSEFGRQVDISKKKIRKEKPSE